MMNELHVWFISWSEPEEEHGQPDLSAAPLTTLLLRSAGMKQSQWALSIPGIITFNHKFHFVVCWKRGSDGGSYVLNMDKLSQLESREVILPSNGSVNSSAVVMGGGTLIERAHI